MPAITIEKIYDRNKNSFNDIRFILATTVLFYHSYEMLPGQKDFITTAMSGQASLGSLAVYAFFILSGFFMIQSLQNTKWVLDYFKKRMYRIIPAFLFSLCLFSFVIIPMFSDINFSGSGGALDFVLKAGSFHLFGYSWEIHNAFPNNFLKDNVNGSMWTLKHELACYILLPIIYILCYSKKFFIFLIFLVVTLLAALSLSVQYSLFNIPIGLAWVLSINEYHSFILFLYYFLSGVVIYLYRERVIVSKRWVAISVLFILLSFKFGSLKYIFMITLPYLFIILGCSIKNTLLSKYGDFSYGIYIYAFPIQQLVIMNMPDVTPILLTLYSFLLTLILSIFSWFAVEKPILKLK